MLLQTNSYIVPKEKRAEHSRLIRRFRQTLLRLGCDHFEVYQQVGSNWSNSESAGRYVQILRFLDRKHQLAVQAAERSDPTAQAVIADFCDLINFPYQQQQGLFAVGFYTSVLPVAPKRGARGELVSTVEHEVIDDPEAELPYPGASDGPPIEEGANPEIIPEAGEAVGETPVADDEFEAVELKLESAEPESAEPETTEPETTEIKPAAEAQKQAHEPMHEWDEPVVEHVTSSASEILHPQIKENHVAGEDDFMKLVDSDLGEEDDLANGFIHTGFADESKEQHDLVHDELVHDEADNTQKPLPQNANQRPPGW